MKTIRPLLVCALSCLAALACPGATLEVESNVFEGKGAGAALATLSAEASEPEAVFAYAAVDLLAAVEQLGHGFYAHGLSFDAGRGVGIPFLRMPVPKNPEPLPTKAEDVRRLLETFYARLAAVDARLEKIDGREFKTVIPLGAANLDFIGQGKAEELIRFGQFFRNVSGTGRTATGDPAATPDSIPFTVAFDQTDALWLRAYTHLLRGLADILLAHDGGELFGATGQLFFTRADTAFARLVAERGIKRSGFEAEQIADLIALVHGVNLPVTDPARLARAREELLAMVRISRATLASAVAETDDDREWLPSPAQNSVFGLRLNAEQSTAWGGVLAEFEALLEGKKLLPHWRFAAKGDGNYGINLRRMFEESRRTDLIGYAQGAAALPYFETGPTTSLTTWRELMRVFGGNFLGYALWIN